jgi:hypothetical protein
MEELESESLSYLSDFERLQQFSSLALNRSRTLRSTFLKFASVLSQNPIPSNFAASFSEFQSKGCLGKQLTNFSSIFRVADSLVRAYLAGADLIRTVIVPSLSDLIVAHENGAARCDDGFAAAKSAEDSARASVRRSSEILSGLSAALNASAVTSSSVSEYVCAVRAHRRRIAELNFAHRRFVDAARLSIARLTSVLVSRESHLKSLLLQFVQIIDYTADVAAKARDEIEENGATSAEDFRVFAAGHGIVRTALLNEEFQPFKFSFEDPAFVPPRPAVSVSDRVIPIAIAQARESFKSEGESELGVTKGERLLLFEKLDPGRWVFVTTADGTRRGFVPAEVVEIVSGRTVFTLASQLTLAEGQPSFGSGELLVVRREEEGVLVCEAVDGTEKRLDPAQVQG